LILLSSFICATPDDGVSLFEYSDVYIDSWGSNDGTNNGASFIATYPSYDVSGSGTPKAVDFTGNVEVTYPTATMPSFNSDFTINFWMYLSGLGATQKIMGQTDGTSFWMAEFNSGDGLIWQSYNGAANAVLMSQGATTGWSQDTWYMITITRDGDDYYIYKDNVQILTQNSALTHTVFTGSLYLGQRGNDGDYFGGLIDTFSTYDNLLTPTLRTELYENGEIGENATGQTLFEIKVSVNATLQSLNNFTATLYSSNYSDTVTTNNGSIYLDIALNNYTLNVTATNYSFFTTELTDINNSDLYTAYLFENNSIYMNIYDAISLLKLDNINISIDIDGVNGTYFNTVLTDNGTYNLIDLDRDTYKSTFYNDDYPRQSFFVTLEDNEHKDLDAYILNNTYVSNVIVTVIDPYGAKVEAATLTMQQNIGGSFVTVSQETTDTTGSSLFYLRIGINYNIIIAKTGYVIQTATITPTSNPYTVTIQLSPISIYNYTIPYDCIDGFVINPLNSFQDYKNINTSFNLSISSADGRLDYFGIYYNSTTYTNITGSPSGALTNLNLNLSVFGDYTIQYFFKCSGNDIYIRNYTYYTSNITPTNSTLIQTLADAKTTNTILQRMSIILFALLLGLLICYEIGLPKIAYSFVSVMVLIIFTIPQVAWIDIKLTTFLGLLMILPPFINWRGDNFG